MEAPLAWLAGDALAAARGECGPQLRSDGGDANATGAGAGGKQMMQQHSSDAGGSHTTCGGSTGTHLGANASNNEGGPPGGGASGAPADNNNNRPSPPDSRLNSSASADAVVKAGPALGDSEGSSPRNRPAGNSGRAASPAGKRGAAAEAGGGAAVAPPMAKRARLAAAAAAAATAGEAAAVEAAAAAAAEDAEDAEADFTLRTAFKMLQEGSLVLDGDIHPSDFESDELEEDDDACTRLQDVVCTSAAPPPALPADSLYVDESLAMLADEDFEDFEKLADQMLLGGASPLAHFPPLLLAPSALGGLDGAAAGAAGGGVGVPVPFALPRGVRRNFSSSLLAEMVGALRSPLSRNPSFRRRPPSRGPSFRLLQAYSAAMDALPSALAPRAAPAAL
jgi:hypothetical protein